MKLDSLAGLASGRRFGPWTLDLDPGERLARLRSLRAIVRLLAGPRGATLATLLHQAETDEDALVLAADALDTLAPVDLRKILGSYAALGRSVAPGRRSGAVQGFRCPTATVTTLPPAPRQGRGIAPTAWLAVA